MNSRYMTDVLFRAIDERMEQGVLDNKKIVLFGLNAPAFACKQYLERHGYEVYAYVDNSTDRIAVFNDTTIKPTLHHLCGDRRICAYTPGALPQQHREEYVFLLYSKYESEMLAQLSSMGYEENEQAFVLGGFWKTEEKMKSFVPDDAGEELDWAKEKRKQIEGMRYIFRTCEKHHLRCYIHYGTLIGAVRHGGYIPWDDDVDLCMPARDLHRLIEIIRAENGRYDVYYAACSDPCRHFIAKIEDRSTVMHQWDIPIELIGGLVIDIFPLGGLPGNTYQEAKKNYDAIMERGWEYDNMVVEFPEAPDDICDKRRLLRDELLAELTRYDWDECEYVFTIADKPGRPRIYNRHIWDERVRLSFEGEFFYGPAGYEEFLACHYGDYMTPPPENRRVSIHRNKIFEKMGISYPEIPPLGLAEPLPDDVTPAWMKELLNEKKHLLVYLGNADLLMYNQAGEEKLERVIHTLTESSENLQILWLQDMDDGECATKLGLAALDKKKQLLQDAFSTRDMILIPWADLYHAVEVADAYYGGISPAIYAMRDRGKPIMIRDIMV